VPSEEPTSLRPRIQSLEEIQREEIEKKQRKLSTGSNTASVSKKIKKVEDSRNDWGLIQE